MSVLNLKVQFLQKSDDALEYLTGDVWQPELLGCKPEILGENQPHFYCPKSPK